jgi:acetyl-CoA carboxylase biotin carboxylase subunit
MEVNPRIQVEHPITEAVTGIDIVEQQIRIAQGEKLNLLQKDITINGWAIEVRINSEDPFKNFQPAPGVVRKYIPAQGQGVFVHSFLHDGQQVYPYFDSLLAKVITWGKTRDEAINKLKRSLDETIIEGVPTTIPFFNLVLRNKDFLKGNFHTNFIEKTGILNQLICNPFLKSEESSCSAVEEEDLANLVFTIYKNIKKEDCKKPKKTNSAWKSPVRFYGS